MAMSPLTRADVQGHMTYLVLPVHTAVHEEPGKGCVAAVWKYDESDLWFDVYGDTPSQAYNRMRMLIRKRIQTGELPELLDRDANFDAWSLHQMYLETGLWHDVAAHKWRPVEDDVAYDVDDGEGGWIDG